MYERVETTCHFLTLFSEIGVFGVFDRDFLFGICSSVRYFTISARSELPRPIKILICRIGRGVPNDFDIVVDLYNVTCLFCATNCHVRG